MLQAFMVLWAVAGLTKLTTSSSLGQNQIVFSGDRPGLSKTVQSFGDGITVNFTFDSIEITRDPIRPLKGFGFLDMTDFDVMCASAAVEHGLLDIGDLDCAASKPNALRNANGADTKRPWIGSNETALKEQGFSPYFDILAFTIKPLGEVKEPGKIGMDSWRVNGSDTTYIDGIGMDWKESSGYVAPMRLSAPEKFPSWGEQVNWVRFASESESGKALDLCVDNIVLRFHMIEKN